MKQITNKLDTQNIKQAIIILALGMMGLIAKGQSNVDSLQYRKISDKDSINVYNINTGKKVATIGICEYQSIAILNNTILEMERWIKMPRLTYSQQLSMLSICDEMIRKANRGGFTHFNVQDYINTVNNYKNIIQNKTVDKSR